MSDEKNEKDTQSESSTDETKSESVTEDVKKTDEPMIPKHRFDEVNNELKRYKEQTQSKPKESSEPKPAVDTERLDAVEFMVKHREFDATDFEAVNALAKGKGVSLEDAAKDEVFLAWHEKKQSEKQSTEATPQTSRSPKVAPKKPVTEMTREEHMEYFNSLLNKGR